ncbi:MAG: lyase family protein [Thermomicrobiales bacterium]|nr:lyase family protein [Thermomicrobiales bacterium]
MSEQRARIERDSMGEMEVPGDALYGATTARAILNFPISGVAFSRSFLRALGLIKAAAATVNGELGLLPAEKVDLIVAAAQEVANGDWDDHSSDRHLPDRVWHLDQYERQR